MRIIGVIPARMASTRFPGKPLALIDGMPMIGHVFHRSRLSQIVEEVYVATCDREIADYIESIGGKVIMTSSSHERASDRVAEAVDTIEAGSESKIDFVVLIQGDEPMIEPEMIKVSVDPLLRDSRVNVTNLMGNLKSRDEQEDPNEIKVVVDKNGFALYFSREPIPSSKKSATSFTMHKQICVISFRRKFLDTFRRLQPTPLERVESIDMLRALEHGFRVKMVQTNFESYSVDTPEDLNEVERLMKTQPLLKQYAT